MLEIFNYYKKDLKQIWQDIEKKYGPHVFKRKDFHFSNFNKLKDFVDKIDFDVILDNKIISKNFIDGKKFIFKDGFLLIRLSGTEPVLRVYVESIFEQKVDEIFNFVEEKLSKKGLR
jgi:phosphomannomutase